MTEIVRRPKLLRDKEMHYCPGCTHGIAHRLLAEVIEELSFEERTVGVASVGCSVLIYEYLDVDFQQSAHGRAPAVATGIKRKLPHALVFTYQGDGDLAAIGMGEVVHAAARGERISVIFINNGIFGMTGGQMAPTTLIGQKTSTCHSGRDERLAGYPIRVPEMLRTLEAPGYLARASLHDPANVTKAKRFIRRAFETQLNDLGFSLVELISSCPTGWGMKPVEALRRIESCVLPYYPVGEFKIPIDGEASRERLPWEGSPSGRGRP